MMKKNNIIVLVATGWLLMLGALNFNELDHETVFGLAPDFFKGILIGLSITANTVATIQLVRNSKQKCTTVK